MAVGQDTWNGFKHGRLEGMDFGHIMGHAMSCFHVHALSFDSLGTILWSDIFTTLIH